MFHLNCKKRIAWTKRSESVAVKYFRSVFCSAKKRETSWAAQGKAVLFSVCARLYIYTHGSFVILYLSASASREKKLLTHICVPRIIK